MTFGDYPVRMFGRCYRGEVFWAASKAELTNEALDAILEMRTNESKLRRIPGPASEQPNTEHSDV